MGALRVGFISLGCCKNLVDSQNIITLLMQEGYRVSSTYEGADVVIVNTCGFIEDSVRESLEVIGEALDHCPNVIVTGCLGPSRDLILGSWPQVKAITGPHSAPAVLEEMRRLFALPEGFPRGRVPPGGILLTPPHYAYLKISEGCSNKCTFCIIPKLRGPLESFPGEDLVARARNYVSRGVKELMVVAQDTSAYGIDRGYPGFLGHERGDLYALMEELAKLGVWLRVHYAYPYPHVTRLIEMMAAGKVLPYMDVPFQHASRHMMQLMKRPGDAERILDTVSGWRKICPDITIRSSFIVGFPGETEDDFRELLDFVREIRLDRVGCFTFSPMAGAPASTMPDQVPEEVKQERYSRFMEVQQQISKEKMQAKRGTVQEVLVDTVDENGIISRTRADAPEIDGVMYLHAPDGFRVRPGDLLRARVTDSDEYDLEGDIIIP
ncbi:30S ribosomal protein S12 methylthiotransferase RimO [Succinimonas amylolytica]|uniref:30S ribosomal protein S12 methylthiotransferase RimO n=1 Tax=Succinimonas amylolytica TaxID=83769 RepID=UPI0023A88CC5